MSFAHREREGMRTVIPTGTRDWWVRAKALIPNGTNTLSKAPERFVNGVYPRFIKSAEGSQVCDTEGRYFTDYISGLGSIILGYGNRHVNSTVTKVIATGSGMLPLLNPLEVTGAEVLSNLIPCAKKVKFFKTGSECVSAAVRVARAYTGKEKVAACGYHGWHDWHTVSTSRNAGIPQALGPLTVRFKYNDPQSLRDLFQKEDIAAVVLEPVVYEEPKDDFLKAVVKIAHDHGALVVFDEVITGLRFGLGGAGARYGVLPDLACFSKALGNGFPIAALVGLEEFMNTYERPDFFVSGTFGGDGVGLAAMLATIEALKFHDEAPLKRIWHSGKLLKDGFNEIAEQLDLETVSCAGMAPRTVFQFPSIEHKALFWQECIRGGVLFGYANFITAAHSVATINTTLGVCELALRTLKEHWDDPKSQLQGDLPQEVFPSR